MEKEGRPGKVIVDLSKLDNNLDAFRRHVPKSKIMGVIKANAYGHGLIPCAKRLEAKGIDYLGVALLEEGEKLREAGIKTPIHVFGGILGSQIERFLKSDLEITASSQSKLEAVDNAASKSGIIAKVHLKIDTGMGRIGVRETSARPLIEFASKLKNIEIKGIFSHFACADEKDLTYTKIQFEKFLPILKFAKKKLGERVLGHIANSAAVLQFTESQLDMVRIGLSMFGIYPSQHLKGKLSLQTVMSVKSKVVFFKVVKAGESVSYGRTWKASQDTRVVTIPIGYGDGYLRALSNKASVLIAGKRYPIVGRICMDQFMVAIANDSAFNGDEVTLVGQDGFEVISIEELADLADTIPYEILTLLNLRLDREFIG